MGVIDTPELAQGYTSANSTQYDAGLFLLDRLALAPGMHVLDVGCGPGNLTAHIAQLVGDKAHVVGVDPSKERIAIAKETYKAAANLSFHVGRAEDLSPFATGSFDVVLVNSTLHWVQDQPLAIEEFARVLKQGGKVGISGSHGDFVAAHERIKEDVLSREPFRQYPEQNSGPVFLRPSEMETLLDRAGLVERKLIINRIVKRANDGLEMIDWLDTSSSGATYGGIPLRMRPMAREQMKREWDKITTEDGIHMDMELLVVVAKKTED